MQAFYGATHHFSREPLDPAPGTAGPGGRTMAPMQAFHADRHRPAAAARAPVSGVQVPAAARARRAWPSSSCARREPAATATSPSLTTPRMSPAIAGTLERRRAARDRLPVERGDGRALPPLGRRDPRRGARGARRRRRRQPRRRHAPRAASARQRLLRLQRRRGRRARCAGRGHRPAAPLRIVVVDLDVHQGDGTAAIFAGDPSVFTLSLHGAKNFPFRKAASDLDVGLPDGCGDADYLRRARRARSAAVWREHAARPFGLAFYLAGADPHEGDRLGRLKLSAARPARARPARASRRCASARIPVALAMAGGYGHDIDVTVAIQAATMQSAVEPGGMEECAAMKQSRRLHERRLDRRSRCRAAYRRFVPLATRWLDNDAYGHLNNVVYFGLFDTAVNGVPDRRRRARHRARRGDRPGGRDALQLLRAARLSAAARGRPARSAGSAARACATRSASSPPARPRPRRAATSSTSTSIARRDRPVPLPDRLLAGREGALQ